MIAITKPWSPSKMTNVSSNIDTCLVCSRTILMLFQTTVTSVERCSHHKYLPGSNKAATSRTHWRQQLSHPVPSKTLQNDHICDWEKENTWLTLLEQSFIFISEDTSSFMDRNQSNVTKILSQWWITLMCWCTRSTRHFTHQSSV